jgi:CHASE3 domain sensor protein
MKTLSLMVDDQLDAALEAVSSGKGRAKSDVITQVLHQYVQTERLRQSLQDPSLAALYEDLAAEDVQFSEEGMADYQRMLTEADAL